MPVRTRLLLFAAAFFAFSSLGFVVDALRPEVYPIRFTLVLAGGTGALAVAYLYSVAFRPGSLWLTVVAQREKFMVTSCLPSQRRQAVSSAMGGQRDDQTVLLIRMSASPRDDQDSCYRSDASDARPVEVTVNESSFTAAALPNRL